MVQIRQEAVQIKLGSPLIWICVELQMKFYVALLVVVLCLAFPVHAPEAQDTGAGASQDDIESLTTVAARQEALDKYLKSAEELRQANELVKAAQALNLAGRLQLKLNRPTEALATFQDSFNLTDQVSHPLTKVDALNGLAATHLHSGKYLDAIPLTHQAIAISDGNNYPRGKGEALLILADCENNKNHTEALKIGNQALTLWQSIGDNRGIARSHLKIGRYHFAQNSLDDATSNYETARNISHSAGFKELEAEALISLGFTDFRRSAWQAVTQYLWDAAKLIDAEADPFKMVQITTATADAYIENGLPQTGVEKWNEALEYIRKTKKPREETIVIWGVGRALLLSGNPNEAKAKFEEALGRAKDLKDPVVQAMCYDYLGRSQAALGDYNSALNSYNTSLDLYSDADNPMEVSRLHALIGQVQENQGQLAEARNFYQQALQRFDGHSDRVNQATTLFTLGRLEMKSGNYELAEKHLRQSIELTENMRRLSTSRELTAAFSATVHDRYERYIQCLMRNHREPGSISRIALALETSESARARSLAELLRVNDTNLLSSVDPELSKKERSFRQLLRIKEDQRVALLRKKYEKSQLEKLNAEQEQLNTEYKKVLATINERYPEFDQLTQPQSWNLRRIQEEVIADDSTVLLEYLLGPDKSFVWAVTRNSITSHELPSQATIDGAVRKVYKLLESPRPENKNELGRASQELAQMILSPVADQLQKQRILVAADGVLNYIPFQILPVTANAEPLVAQHEVINVPSASILGELRRETARRGSRNKVLAAFGDPVFRENVQIVRSRSDSGDPESIGPLFYAGREIASLREVASEEQTYAVTESDATRDQLLKLDLSQYSILHFATHGLLRPSSPENSGLWLSTIDREGKAVDGFVGLQDIYSLRAPVDLVVLSACQTGLGKDTHGEGLIGLTRGFMYAGATSVVASLWKVEDEATAELMKRFYTEMLKNRKTPSEALRLAQNDIRQNPQWSAPHYWAGFTLQGEYGYVVNVPPAGWRPYQIILLSTIVVLVLASGAYLVRRRIAK